MNDLQALSNYYQRMKPYEHQTYHSPYDGMPEAFAQGIYEAPGDLVSMLEGLGEFTTGQRTTRPASRYVNNLTQVNELGYNPDDYNGLQSLQTLARFGGNVIGDPLNAIPGGYVAGKFGSRLANEVVDQSLKPSMSRQLGAIGVDDLPMDEASRMQRASEGGIVPNTPENMKRFFNASTVGYDPKGYLEPHVSDWVTEVASGASDEIPLEDMVQDLLYLGDKPTGWINSIVGRKVGKHSNDVTLEDIRRNGRLNIMDIDPEYDEIYQVGDYSTDQKITNLAGERIPFYESSLYDEGNVYSGEGRMVEMPVGPEPNDWISNQTLDVSHSLTGDDLINYLVENGMKFNQKKIDSRLLPIPAGLLGLNALEQDN